MVEYKLRKTVGKFSLRALLGTVLVIAMVTPSLAMVEFDPETGTGFVGKGDVQTALGWNNAALQRNVSEIMFSYNAVNVYNVTVKWETTTGGKNPKIITHSNVHEINVAVNGSVQHEERVHKQVDGFIMTGFIGEPAATGSIPAVGDVFNPNNGAAGAKKYITAIELVSSTGGMYVNFDGSSVLLE
jgi:hypothetical protein